MSESMEACLDGVSEAGSCCQQEVCGLCVHMCASHCEFVLGVGGGGGELCDRVCVWEDLGLTMMGQLGFDMGLGNIREIYAQ